jgi:SAM-dependent methyltransferase
MYEMKMEFSFPRYLAAKKSVDDRALNRLVWQTMAEKLSVLDTQTPLRVIEIGAGIGTMAERMLEWGLLKQAEYLALDAMPENIATAWQRLPVWAKEHGYTTQAQADQTLSVCNAQQAVEITFRTGDLFDFAAHQAGRPGWDLLVAHAFLDLMDIACALPVLRSLVKPGGLFYLTINFDGATLFEPAIDPGLDEQIQMLYHRNMDERLTDGKPSGDSCAGRHLFHMLPKSGIEILQAGASDWVVYAGRDGYPEDEAYFLHFIIHTLDQALQNHPELDKDQFANWVAKRHAQIESGELVYIAHQLDFAGILPVGR